MRTKGAVVTRDKLYDAAFRYKKVKIWKKLWDSEVFAVKLKSGETGYVCIMGRNGEYNALALYIGQEGFESYWRMADMERYSGSELKNHELLLQQKCLQVALENKEDLRPDEVDEVRAYAKKNGIRLSGKNAFPQFIKFEPGYHPWKVKTQADMSALLEATEAAILLADLLEDMIPMSLGIAPIDFDTEEVPLFSVEQGELQQIGFVPLPKMPEETYVYAKAENQIALAAVKKLPKKGIWESEIVRLPEAAQDDPEEAPYYPLLLMIIENKSHFLLPIPIMVRNDTDPQTMLQAFADAWKTHKTYPKEIRCRDERTYALLKDFCEKTGVKISIYEGMMPALDEAEDNLWERFGEEDGDDYAEDMMGTMIDSIFSLSKDELRMLPKPLVEQLRFLISQNAFPGNVAAELNKKLKGL